MSDKGITIKVCMGGGGIAAGGAGVLEAFGAELRARGIDASLGANCLMHKVGCRGLCSRDVIVDVVTGGEKSTYQFIKPEMVPEIVEGHIVNGTPVSKWLVGDDYRGFNEKQTRVVFSDCGSIDPDDIKAYIGVGGYEALKDALMMSPAKVIETIKDSGLRGRGGAGFPAGQKWEICRAAPGGEKYIICNADEGGPLLEGNPHAVVEGMAVGGYAIGASMGYVYIRADAALAVERLGGALRQARKRSFLGKDVLGSGFDFDIEIKLGAGAFICGEETALIASIEGLRGMPSAKPPYPAQRGLWGMPTVVNNVETLSNVPHIIKKGAGWFSSIGTESSSGTKVFALTGKVKNQGFIEVALGMTLREIIYDIGGGIEGGKALKAVHVGGYSGGCIPAGMIETKVDYESLAMAGSIVGSGVMIVFDEDDCMVNSAKTDMQFNQSESCGKCVPCRIGTKRMFEILERLTQGEGTPRDMELLLSLSGDIKAASLCGHGQTAPNPVLSTIKHFRQEYEAHLEGRCPAKVCRRLLTFHVIEEFCKGCGACMRACPAGAVSGQKKKLHSIDQEVCIKCGACFDVCKFKAVGKQ